MVVVIVIYVSDLASKGESFGWVLPIPFGSLATTFSEKDCACPFSREEFAFLLSSLNAPDLHSIVLVVGISILA